ncbi:hypothetical protein GCM10010324_11760 [Streptomyces hiroshimensis]|uniref:Uncharacterized protein n=1 Tax=Streptomyces hiroshimensis TaxID=66424 RepID=A0ABQ2Y5Y9_9ACTN|nr:hypothetical protein GCM10010324_11760 [Streptomyces hiroshimensis]
MGRLQDKWLGTKYPDSDVVPLSTAEVQDALLAVNGPGVPYRVRNANPSEEGDLVAEWLIQTSGFEPGQQELRKLRIRMCLGASGHEVRTLQEQWTSSRGRLSRSRGYSRGRGFMVERAYERGPDGRRRWVTTLDTRDMRNALRKVVLSSGWTWRGVRRL